jgi:hypothetical protein
MAQKSEIPFQGCVLRIRAFRSSRPNLSSDLLRRAHQGITTMMQNPDRDHNRWELYQQGGRGKAAVVDCPNSFVVLRKCMAYSWYHLASHFWIPNLSQPRPRFKARGGKKSRCNAFKSRHLISRRHQFRDRAFMITCRTIFNVQVSFRQWKRNFLKCSNKTRQ